MKKRYETPEIEKMSFETDEPVCNLFTDLFKIDVASGGTDDLTKESVFDWGELQ